MRNIAKTPQNICRYLTKSTPFFSPTPYRENDKISQNKPSEQAQQTLRTSSEQAFRTRIFKVGTTEVGSKQGFWAHFKYIYKYIFKRERSNYVKILYYVKVRNEINILKSSFRTTKESFRNFPLKSKFLNVGSVIPASLIAERRGEV